MTPETAARAILALFILAVFYTSWFIAIPWMLRRLRELRDPGCPGCDCHGDRCCLCGEEGWE